MSGNCLSLASIPEDCKLYPTGTRMYQAKHMPEHPTIHCGRQTTKATPGMSRPRDATSVATRTPAEAPSCTAPARGLLAWPTAHRDKVRAFLSFARRLRHRTSAVCRSSAAMPHPAHEHFSLARKAESALLRSAWSCAEPFSGAKYSKLGRKVSARTGLRKWRWLQPHC